MCDVLDLREINIGAGVNPVCRVCHGRLCGEPVAENCVDLPSLLLAETHKQDGAACRDALHKEHGEHHDEDRAERETELALVPPNVLAGLLHEEPQLLPAAQSRSLVFLGVHVIVGGHLG